MPDAAPYGSLEEGLVAAQDAQGRGNLIAVLGIYSDLRLQYPGSPAPFQRAASVLLDALHHDEADFLLEAGQERFPSDAGLAIDHAWVAHRRRDAAEALRRWARVRTAFPDHPVGYTGAIATLRDDRQFDAAEALLLAAGTRFPDSPEPAIELAWMAVAQRDWDTAVPRWEAVRTRFPDHWLGYTGGAAALRDSGRFGEAETLLQSAITRFPHEPQPLVDHAVLAATRRDWAAALTAWDAVMQRTLDRMEAYTGKALALRELQQFDPAETVLREAATRWPHHPVVVIDRAWLAHVRRDWPEAVRRWEWVRQLFPDRIVGSTNGAAALREAGRIGEAEALLTEAMLRCPDNDELWQEHARLAQARRDWPEAIRRWERVRSRFPDDEAGYLNSAICRRECGEFDAAEQMLRDAATRFPNRAGPLLELGRLAHRRGALIAAIDLWARLRDRFPDQVEGFTGGAVALRDSNRLAEAEALAIAGQTRFPHEPGPVIEQAWLAYQAQHHLEAARRFEQARVRFPGEPVGWLGHARALTALGRGEEAGTILREGIARFPRCTLLSEDAAKLPERLRIETDAALPVPVVIPPGQIRLVLCGFHLAHQISLIFARLPALRGRIEVHLVDAGSDPGTIPALLPERIDHYFEESSVGNPETRRIVRATLPAACGIHTFPTPRMHALWPFLGADTRLIPEPPIYNGGRYPNTDRIAARLVLPELTDDALFDAYMALCEADKPDLDAMLADDVARWEADDQLHDVRLAGFLRDTFRTARLFASPYERGADVLRAIVLQLFDAPMLRDGFGAPVLRESLDRLTHGWVASHQELPVHPLVARHFELGWWSPDLGYRLHGNTFTFRAYITRYLRWSPLLP